MSEVKFPPVDWLWRYYGQNAAWYSGEMEALRREGLIGRAAFWKSEEEIKIHVPMAADLSAISAAMIFADSPVVTCEHERTNGRIAEILQKNGAYAVLLQAAELASAFGGVFLKWSWDVADGFPRLTAVPADAGMPYWSGGKISEIKLWNVVREDDKGSVWRTEESYTPDGHIRTKLFRGDTDNLGKETALNSIPETEEVQPDASCGGEAMLACYVPNIMPNRLRPHTRLGRSDYDELYGLFDALDEAYSAIQRETRLTKTMVVVPMEYLRKKEDIRHKFNSEAKASEWVLSNGKGAFVALDIDTTENSSPITLINPEIRAESRAKQVEDIIRRIVSLAGYAPQSIGLDVEGSAESGTALSMRERKSARTTETKKNYWWHALHDMISAMLVLDKNVFRSGIDDKAEISVELPTNSQPDISQLAQIVEQLERAEAVSIETKVNILHPDWNDEQRAEEVQRIRAENGAAARANMNRLLEDPTDPKEDEE